MYSTVTSRRAAALAAEDRVLPAVVLVDVEATLGRLAFVGLRGPPRRVTQSTPRGPITLATVRDPDELLVLLTPGSITRNA